VIRRLLLLVSIPAAAFAQAAPAPKPEIYLREPANGATVERTFTVAFGLRNYGVAPAGIDLPNTGHFHILIDNAALPAAGAVIPPNDSTTRHFGLGQIEVKLTLSPGTHTLRVVLGDFAHKVIGPDLVSAPIRITVRP
jgi:hypothetical protein